MPAFTFKKICGWCEQYQAAQRGEVSEVQPVMVAPWKQGMSSDAPVTYALLAINFLVFGLMVASGISIESPTSQELLRWGANYGPMTMNGQWWRLVSHMFVHIGLIHLAFNMYFLYRLGTDCERLLGSVTYAGMYLVAGIAGGVASLLWHPYVTSAGASGALFGILGAMIAVYYFGEFSMPRALVRYSLRSMLMCAGINLLWGMTGGIDNAAHIGGMLTGVVVGFLVAKVAPEAEDLGRRAMVLLLVAGMVGGGVFWLQKAAAPQRLEHEAMQMVRLGRTKEAIVAMQKAVKAAPANVDFREQLAYVYEMDGQFDAAVNELQQVLAMSKVPNTRQWAYMELGTAYQRLSKPEQAKAMYQQLLKEDPKSAAAHLGQGELAASQEQHEAAIAEFQKAVALNPELPGAYSGMGFSYAKLKKNDEAIAAYKKELELEGDDAEEDTRKALADLEKARPSPAGARK